MKQTVRVLIEYLVTSASTTNAQSHCSAAADVGIVALGQQGNHTGTLFRSPADKNIYIYRKLKTINFSKQFILSDSNTLDRV